MRSKHLFFIPVLLAFLLLLISFFTPVEKGVSPAQAQTLPTPTAYFSYLPLVMRAKPTTWYSQYPLCYAEDIDPLVDNSHSPDDNDALFNDPDPTIAVGDTCIGWIHYTGYWGDSRPSDHDYFYYEVPEGLNASAIRITLTHLPANYTLVWYPTDNSTPTELFSINPGTQDEAIEAPARPGIYTIHIEGAEDYAYDPDNPYLLSVQATK